MGGRVAVAQTESSANIMALIVSGKSMQSSEWGFTLVDGNAEAYMKEHLGADGRLCTLIHSLYTHHACM